jgi:signal transduction histidine kinase
MAYAADYAGERRAVRPLRYVGVGCIGVVAAVSTGLTVSRSSVLLYAPSSGALRAVYVASFFAVGIFSWWRRPGGRLGPLLIVVGSVYAMSSLNASAEPVAFTAGMGIFAVYIVLLSFVYLSFPSGWLETRLEWRLVAALGLVTVLLWIPILAIADTLPTGGPFANCGDDCPPNGLQVVEARASIGRALDHGYQLLSAAVLVGIAVLIVRKARSPVRLRRRAHGPLAVAFVGLIAGYLLYQAVAPSQPGTEEAFRIVLATASLAAPAAILLGQIWGSVSVATGLGQISLEAGREPLNPRRMQALIGEALGDPTLRLALWRRERTEYVDVEEEPIVLPTDQRSRGVTLVERDGVPLAALIHAPDLDVDPEVVDALAATSLLLLENTRLVQELRASRARIVDAADNERLRLERDLHDGAQQRLLAIEIKLSLVRKRIADEEVARLLDEVGQDAVTAHHELLELAHGIYPTVLRERGLADALRAVSTTAALPVGVRDEGVGRCSPTIEAAVYFCCLEAIQNASKHAGSGARVSVILGRHRGAIDFEVSDDGGGIGRSEASSGMGLTSMRDRIGAVGGELDIVSSPEVGTTVRGSIPTGDSIAAR